MVTIIVLFGSFAALMILSRTGILFRYRTKKELAAYAMSIFLLFFGVSHFFLLDEMVQMIPAFLPYPVFIVYLTGFMEIILAIGIMMPKTRKLSGILIALFFIAVFPANVVKVMNGVEVQGAFNSSLMSWIRLFFQPIFILWALYCSKEDKVSYVITSKKSS